MTLYATRYTSSASAKGANHVTRPHRVMRSRRPSARVPEPRARSRSMLVAITAEAPLAAPEPEHAEEKGRERGLHTAGDQRRSGDHDAQGVGIVQPPEASVVPRRDRVERQSDPRGDEDEADQQGPLEAARPLDHAPNQRVVRQETLGDPEPAGRQEEEDRL